jgi:hypothetical protein
VTFANVINLINSYASVRQTIDQSFKITPQQIAQILDMTGTPRELFFGEDKTSGLMTDNAALLEQILQIKDAYGFTEMRTLAERSTYPSLQHACMITRALYRFPR